MCYMCCIWLGLGVQWRYKLEVRQTMTAVTTIDSKLLSSADRARVTEALREIEQHEDLPVAVLDSLRRLCGLVAAGQNASIVATDTFLTSSEAAVMLGMSRPFLAKLLDEGCIPFHRNGRDRRIAMSDVVTFIEERDRLKREHAEAAASYHQRRSERLAALAGVSAEEAEELGFG